MSPLVMFNHLLFVNTFPARILSQSAPGPPRDPETENIPISFLALPLGPQGRTSISHPAEGLPQEPQSDPSEQAGQGKGPTWSEQGARTSGHGLRVLSGWSQGASRLTPFSCCLLSALEGCLSILFDPLLSPPPDPGWKRREIKEDPLRSLQPGIHQSVCLNSNCHITSNIQSHHPSSYNPGSHHLWLWLGSL